MVAVRRAPRGPRNGILLNTLFDRAFDRGLFTLDDDLRVIISPTLVAATHSAALTGGFKSLEGRSIHVPDRFPPDLDAIRFHREHMYRG